MKRIITVVDKTSSVESPHYKVKELYNVLELSIGNRLTFEQIDKYMYDGTNIKIVMPKDYSF